MINTLRISGQKLWVGLGLIFIAIYLPLPKTLANPQTLNSAEIRLALKKLSVLGNALYIAAHPDDENTALLAYLSKERLVGAAYLSLTRGEGGQNLIGAEQGPLLGLIRTQELLAARKIDGAKQFFTSAPDFGYSKTPQETLEMWNQETVLAEMVLIIRQHRPDVIFTRFPPTHYGGHGHHTASAMLALEAFHAAGDATRFPEQLTTVQPWQAKRIFWNTWRPNVEDQKNLLQVDLGAYNPLLGKSYTEIAGASRSMHKSQGFGAPQRTGERLDYYQLLEGDSVTQDFFDDIDLSWARVEGCEAIAILLQQAVQDFHAENPAASIPLLLRIYGEMENLKNNWWCNKKQQELLEIIRACAGLEIEANATEPSVTPGDNLQFTASILNRCDYPFVLQAIEYPYADQANVMAQPLTYNQPLHFEHAITLPAGTAEHMPTDLQVRFSVKAGQQTLYWRTPIQYRWTDPVAGDQARSLVIAPAVTVNFAEDVVIFPAQESKTLRLKLKSSAASVTGKLKLKHAEGWQIAPEFIPFTLATKGEELQVSFSITPPAGTESTMITALIENEDTVPASSRIEMHYAHIPWQTIFFAAKATLTRIDLQIEPQKIGYIMGSGDEIPTCLRQIGFFVDELSEAQFTQELDLSAYQTIIIGVRAYNTRERLKHLQKQLMNFVEQGGTLLVQYNVAQNLLLEDLGPYPFKISRDRVTEENAPITITLPQHPLLNYPNKISEADFANWVQERGLYFASEWDDNYQTPLACNDTGETPRLGGLLYAKYGKGIFIYTGYAWFRQLPAGVPGAYRIFVNLISAPSTEK